MTIADLAKQSLEDFMSDISEDCYAAGWNMGLEYDLWGIVRGFRDRCYGMELISDEQIERLNALAEHAGGWCAGRGFMPMADWQKEYARWFEDEHLPSMRRWVEYRAGEVGGKPDFVGRVTTIEDVEKARKQLAEDEARLPLVKAEASPTVPGQATEK